MPIVEAVAPELQSGDVVAILSNGGFGGIYESFRASWRSCGVQRTDRLFRTIFAVAVLWS